LLLEQVVHQVHMTQEVVPMLVHLAPIHHWEQLLLLSVADTAAPVIVLEQGVVQDRVDRVVVVGTNTDQVAQALSGKAMLAVHPAHHHHMAQVAVAQVALAEITIAVQAATAALV
jgi:hypothetical protein